MKNRQALSADDSRIKVLVVDDHPNTAIMLARAISRLGSHVEVVSATSGLEALQHIEDGAADILITDMMMPEMTGMELIETLNDRPSISPAVTFLLTAHDSAGVREIAQRLNVKEVIAKPVHPEWVCQLISQTMDELKRSKSVDSETVLQKEAKTNPRQEDLNINRLLWDVAKKFQPQADMKNQLLVVGRTETVSNVRGNAVQLRQALRALVWSAIKNTPKGGTVILSSENEANVVKILVRDTGYGITSTGEDLIEDSNGTQKNDFEENDQDLTTVKTIAEQHGGNVTVKSEPGKGSCFMITLPTVQRNLEKVAS